MIPAVVRAVAVTLALLTLGPPVALAQEVADSADDRATARLLAEEADQKLEAGDLRGALELFQRADAIYPAPTLKLVAARTLVRLGQLIEAHELLLTIGRGELPRTAPAPWTAARDTARQEATALAPRIPRVQIHLEGLLEGAASSVLLDGRRIPRESLDVPRPINPGPHRLRAEAPGHVPAEQTIQMAEGEVYQVTLKVLPEKAAVKAVASGSASSARPGGPRPGQGSVTSAGGSLLAWVGFSVGGAALLTGSIVGLVVRSRVSDLKAQCSGNACPPDLRDDADRARTLATVADVSFVLAALGAGVGVYGLFASPRNPTPAQTTRRWHLDVGPGSALVRGSF